MAGIGPADFECECAAGGNGLDSNGSKNPGGGAENKAPPPIVLAKASLWILWMQKHPPRDRAHVGPCAFVEQYAFPVIVIGMGASPAQIEEGKPQICGNRMSVGIIKRDEVWEHP